jgi:hypothetical protein
MTLTEYETAVAALPTFQRGQAAGPAQALRQRLTNGEPFVASRDVIVTQRQHYARLQATNGQLATFAALTGP